VAVLEPDTLLALPLPMRTGPLSSSSAVIRARERSASEASATVRTAGAGSMRRPSHSPVSA